MSRGRKRGRRVDGLVILNKPSGITSNRILQRVRGVYGAQKAGHTGTLDPFATGVLPICFGEATKFSQYLLNSDKEYLATVKLGITTNTGDVDGECVQVKPVPNLTLDDIRQYAAAFEGVIEQIPPMYSALKQGGQPLHVLARQGIEVDRQARTVRVLSQFADGFDATEQTFDWLVSCSKGTYVRTLVEDLGNQIGCGAHVQALQRRSVGGFILADSVEFECLQSLRDAEDLGALDALVKPIGALFRGWKRVVLSPALCEKLQQGQSIPYSVMLESEHMVCVLSQAGEVVGVAQAGSDGQLRPRRMVSTAEDDISSIMP